MVGAERMDGDDYQRSVTLWDAGAWRELDPADKNQVLGAAEAELLIAGQEVYPKRESD